MISYIYYYIILYINIIYYFVYIKKKNKEIGILNVLFMRKAT